MARKQISQLAKFMVRGGRVIVFRKIVRRMFGIDHKYCAMFWRPEDHYTRDPIATSLKRSLWRLEENENYRYAEFKRHPFFPMNVSLEEEVHRLLLWNMKRKVYSMDETLEEVWEDFRQNGRDSEYCPEFEVAPAVSPYLSEDFHPYTSCAEPAARSDIFKRVRVDRRAKPSQTKGCVFCKNNGVPESTYMNHCVKDTTGRVMCPVLRAFKCPKCEATGDNAHTIKYCPFKDIIEFPIDSQRLPRKNCFYNAKIKHFDTNNNTSTVLNNMMNNFRI